MDCCVVSYYVARRNRMKTTQTRAYCLPANKIFAYMCAVAYEFHLFWKKKYRFPFFLTKVNWKLLTAFIARNWSFQSIEYNFHDFLFVFIKIYALKPFKYNFLYTNLKRIINNCNLLGPYGHIYNIDFHQLNIKTRNGIILMVLWVEIKNKLISVITQCMWI